MLMPTESAFNLIPVFGWPGFIPYHSRKRTRQPRGSTRPSVSKSSCTIAHHPTENGEAEPQSMERKRIHSLGTSNGLMTCRPTATAGGRHVSQKAEVGHVEGRG